MLRRAPIILRASSRNNLAERRTILGVYSVCLAIAKGVWIIREGSVCACRMELPEGWDEEVEGKEETQTNQTRKIKAAISIKDLDESLPEKARGDMQRRKGGMGMAERDSAGRPRLGIEGRELDEEYGERVEIANLFHGRSGGNNEARGDGMGTHWMECGRGKEWSPAGIRRWSA